MATVWLASVFPIYSLSASLLSLIHATINLPVMPFFQNLASRSTIEIDRNAKIFSIIWLSSLAEISFLNPAKAP